jgi:hypothetical protein
MLKEKPIFDAYICVGKRFISAKTSLFARAIMYRFVEFGYEFLSSTKIDFKRTFAKLNLFKRVLLTSSNTFEKLSLVTV